MERETVLLVAALALCGPPAWAMGLLPPVRRLPASGRIAEATAWRRPKAASLSLALRLARLLGREAYADVVVEDPTETSRLPAAVSIAAAIERAPRVRAADAELRAAQLELAAHERSIWPEVTVGAFYGYSRRDVPAGSFHGPGSAGLSASWTDTEIGFRLQFPLPIFERKQTERALASGRILLAGAQAWKARADVRLELESSWTALETAQKAFDELAKTPEIVAREFDLLEKSFRAGALDAVARTVAMRSLQEAAARYDSAGRDLRIAQASWERWARAVR